MDFAQIKDLLGLFVGMGPVGILILVLMIIRQAKPLLEKLIEGGVPIRLKEDAEASLLDKIEERFKKVVIGGGDAP